MKARRTGRAAVLVVTASLAAAALVFAQPPPFQAQLAQAREQFERGEHEAAIAALDLLILAVEPLAPKDPAAAKLLPSAYELRARTRFQLGKSEEAGADLGSLLRIDPAFRFTEKGVPTRLVRLLDEVRKVSVGTIVLNLSPVDAELELDGRPFTQAAGPIPLPVGSHTLSGKRPGCRSASQTFAVTPGATTEVVLALERIAATVSLVTSPPEVEVIVNGVSRGRTEAGPQPPRWAEPIAQAGLQPRAVSKPFLLDDLGLGSHTFNFTRECHVAVDLRADITTLTDKYLGPVKLERAVGSITVESQASGATVWLDGEAKGAAPVQIDNVCEGPRTVELRSPWGRFINRLELRTGDHLTVKGVVKPTVAVLAVNGLPTGYMGTDLRLELETRFAPAGALTLFAPPIEKVDQVLGAEKLPRGWLAFNSGRSPMEGVASAITPAARLQIGGRLAKALEVQGLAELTAKPGGERSQYLLSILAAESAEPDVLELTIDNPQSVRDAMARLDRVPEMSRPWAGVAVADVLDVSGAVVLSVDAAASKAGIVPGDIITKAGDRPVADGSSFVAVVAAQKAAGALTVEMTGRTGAPRKAVLPIVMAPRLVAMNDQSLLFNTLVLALRTRLVTAGASPDPIVRLNLAVALMRLGNYADARVELGRVKLDPGPGISAGTVQYLLGLCHEQLGASAEAEKAWRAAAADPDALLTEDGPFIWEVAGRKLAQYRK